MAALGSSALSGKARALAATSRTALTPDAITSTSLRCASGVRPFQSCPQASRAAYRQVSKGRRLQRFARCAAAPQPKVALFGFGGGDDEEEEDLTVCKLQIGVFGRVDDFQRQLDRVARLLDTDDEESLSEMVRETVLFINRNLEYCAYGASATFRTPDYEEAERKFNEASLKERTKFKRETLSNFGGRLNKDSLPSGQAGDVGLDKWLAITLLVVVEYELDLPKVRAAADLRKALNTLASLAAEDVVAAELLWTPQEEGDGYSKDELLADYPGLANL